MLQILLSLALAAPFEARTLDGQTAAGELTALGGQEVVLSTDDGPASFPLKKLATLAPRPATSVEMSNAPLWVELMDGSRLAATGYTVAGGKATIVTGEASHEVPTSTVRWVRFGTASDFEGPLAKQWDDIAGKKAAGDLLVVRKEQALDYLEGITSDINAEVCQFELDGEVIDVKLPRVTGIVYAHPREVKLPEAIGSLQAIDGTRLQLANVELAEDRVKFETPAGTAHEIPLAEVARFDFSSGKIAFLSDLEPESATFTPLVGFEKPPQGLLEFYEYRRDIGFEQNPLRLDGREFGKGLSLASRTQLVYRLPDAFRLLRATVGIDDATRATGSVHLEIKGDGRKLWEGEVRGSDPAQDLELEIAGVKRIEILADYGDGLDVGDRLNLCDAQVTK